MESLISRNDAIQSGSPTYFTGKPCLRGHVASRRVINRSCVICNAEKDAARRIANPPTQEAVMANRAKAAAWAKANPERYAANQRRAAERRGEKPRPPKMSEEERSEKARVWRKKNRQKNRAKLDAKRREWVKRNPEAAKSIARAGWINRRARNKAAGKVSASDVRTIRSAKVCAACGNEHTHMEIDHKVALSRGGTNELSNLQLLCRPCNRSKWAKDMDEWAAEKFGQETE